MDPVGAALGAAGLLLAFNSCLEGLELINLGKSHARDITLLEQLFDNQQYRLLTWAKSCFPSVQELDPRLQEPEIHERLVNNLTCIALLFQDRERLRKRYGLKESTNTGLSKENNARCLPFQQRFEQFVASLPQRQKATGLKSVSKWAIRDRRKFRELLDDLSQFIADLERSTQFLDQHQLAQRRMVDLEIATLSDDERQLVAEATCEYGDLISAAAVEYQTRSGQASSGPAEVSSNGLYLDPFPHPEILFEDEEETMSVLFADFGNSCRSPMAEAVFKRLAENLPKISTVDSAGTGGYGALMPTDARTVTTLYRHGIDSTRRRPRQIIPADFEEFTYILAMDQASLEALRRMEARSTDVGMERGGARIRLFGPSDDLEAEVRDPFYKDEAEFEGVYEQIIRFSEQFFRDIGAFR